MPEHPIDIVIPWVDANDPEWRKEKNKWSGAERQAPIDDADARYRDWDTVRYLFRGIGKHLPWVNKVFFLTWGHLPHWLDTCCGKLQIVQHKEFIPSEYLPTFCSHVIELNLHRIDALSEHFVYFNDDLLVMRDLPPEFFFKNGLPRDYAILNPISCEIRGSVQDIALSDLEIVNSRFDKKSAIRRWRSKWFAPCYGKYLFRTLCLLSWPYFAGFFGKHQCNAFLKSTFSEVWEKESGVLDSTCRHRFRTRRDVNQWLMRYWQLASGRFEPIKPYGKLFNIGNGNTRLFREIAAASEPTLCVNDNGAEPIADFEATKAGLLSVLDAAFPEKSCFER